MTQPNSEPFGIADALALLEHAKICGEMGKELQLKVRVHTPGKVGGSGCVSVTGMYLGFDWDAGKVLIHTDKQLTTMSPEDVEAINKSVKEGQSWHAYQQHKKHTDTIKGHEAEIAKLKQDVADAKQAAKWESDLCGQALADMKKHEAQCKEAQRIAGGLFAEIKDPNSVAGDAYVEYFERVTGVSIESASGIATANP
jgi:hypothetical protein